MSKDIYVYSTSSASVAFTLWEATANKIPKKQKTILIHGGANVATKQLVTPRGVVTKITQEELDQLLTIRQFNEQVAAGFLTYSTNKVDADKAAADQEGRDGSAPIVPQDYDENDPGAKPVEQKRKAKK